MPRFRSVRATCDRSRRLNRVGADAERRRADGTAPHVDDSAVTVRRRRRHGRNAADQRRSSALRCEHSTPTTTYKPNARLACDCPKPVRRSHLSPTAPLQFPEMANRWRRAPAQLRSAALVGPSPPIPMKREKGGAPLSDKQVFSIGIEKRSGRFLPSTTAAG
ncbi:hypothetical protein MRX96_003720 [Rhipicephalus microplus]